MISEMDPDELNDRQLVNDLALGDSTDRNLGRHRK
jgi:hypothetical protein